MACAIWVAHALIQLFLSGWLCDCRSHKCSKKQVIFCTFGIMKANNVVTTVIMSLKEWKLMKTQRFQWSIYEIQRETCNDSGGVSFYSVLDMGPRHRKVNTESNSSFLCSRWTVGSSPLWLLGETKSKALKCSIPQNRFMPPEYYRCQLDLNTCQNIYDLRPH